jgi:hypothetical protein
VRVKGTDRSINYWGLSAMNINTAGQPPELAGRHAEYPPRLSAAVQDSGYRQEVRQST